MNSRYGKGFSLIELMIVVAVLAIVGAIAYPAYEGTVRNGRRADAKAALMQLGQFMERNYTSTFSYSRMIGDDGNPRDVANADLKDQLDGDRLRYYDYTLAAVGQTTFTLRATPKGTEAQAGDGFLELGSDNTRGWDRDNSGAIGADEGCWQADCS